VTDRFEPEALRLLLLGTHYRSPINFSDQLLSEAEKRLDYLYETVAKARAALGAQPDGASAPAGFPAGFEGEFQAAMDDDINTAQALGVLSAPFSRLNELAERPAAGPQRSAQRVELATLLAGVARAAAVLGVAEQDPGTYLERRRARAAARSGLDVSKVAQLIAERVEARKAKEFARADALRKELLDMGVEIMDGPGGTAWKLVQG
jgi:cysteinyl-tRNA synthetase